MTPDFPPPPSNLSAEPKSEQPSVEESPTNVEGPSTVATVDEGSPQINEPTSQGEAPVVSNALNNLNVDSPEADDYVGDVTVVDKDFTYPTHTDPMRVNTSHGVYLDDEQRKAAEIQRAKIEGRDPDLENPPAVQGTPLVRTSALKATLPGDYVVEPDKQLPVTVGVPESARHEYGDAIKAQEVLDARSAKNEETQEQGE